MLTKKAKAVPLFPVAKATAQYYHPLNKSYRNPVSTSRAKLQIGTLLLALQSPLSRHEQQKCWALFESKLKQYLDFRCSEVAL